jgi:hypothetical protein
MSDTSLLPGMVCGFGKLLLTLSLAMMLTLFNGVPLWSWRDYFIGLGVGVMTPIALISLLMWVLS